MVYFVLLLKVTLFILFGGLAFFAVTTRFFIEEKEKEKMVFLFSLGMGPAMSSLLLYYLYLIVPGQENLVYLGSIVAVFAGLVLTNRKAPVIYLHYWGRVIRTVFGIFNIGPVLFRSIFNAYTLLIAAGVFSIMTMLQIGYYRRFFYAFVGAFLAAVFLFIVSKRIREDVIFIVTERWRMVKAIFTGKFSFRDYPFFTAIHDYLFKSNNALIWLLMTVIYFGIGNILLTFQLGHDFLEYMVQGGYIYDNRSIAYVSDIYNPVTGFYYVGLHGWSFPLQFSLGQLVDGVTQFGFGLYFQSLTLWYGILLLVLAYVYIKKHVNKYYACAAVLILMFAKGFLTAISFSHIDAYRIFFFSLALMFTLELVRKPDAKMVPVLAFVAGTSAFSHSLGVIVAVILGATILLYVQKNWLTRIGYAVGFGLLTLAFGGVHYLLDVFYGTGWIFKEIDFY